MISFSDVRDAVALAVPIVLGAMTLWKRTKPAIGALFHLVQTEFNEPIDKRLDVVEDEVHDLNIKVNTISEGR